MKKKIYEYYMFKINSTQILLIIILIFIAFIYNRYDEKQRRENGSNDYEAIQKYLLNESMLESDLEKSKKPILWIHIINEYNARSWESFGSRSSFELNQPYMYLTVKSIIAKCDKSFHICLIDDNSFAKLLPNWQINMSTISDPILANVRQLALTNLLFKYGGVIVPPSFLCMKDLIEMYNIGTRNNRAFVCEMVDRNITSTTKAFYPNIQFMGAPKQNQTVENLSIKIQELISKDYTAQSVFLGDLNRWADEQIRKKQKNLVDGKLIGTKTLDDEPVLIDDLLSNNYINIYPNTYGIYIPADEILNRRYYEWFARLSPKQVLESKIIISKYILVANIPELTPGKIEAYQGENEAIEKKDIKYWKTPLQAPVWGLMPLGLGDKVLSYSSEPNFNG